MPRNFLGDFYEENKRGGLTGRDFNHFNDQSSENRSNTILNDNFMNQTPVGQLNQGTYRDFEFNKKLDPFCVDCCVKIEGLKTIMKDMIEIDKVALPITSDYTEYIISKMGLEKKDILLQYGNKELIAKTLNTSCTTVRLLLDSCYTLAPYHAQGFEKVFKTICYFFELMIRAHTTSQKNLILQLEQ